MRAGGAILLAVIAGCSTSSTPAAAPPKDKPVVKPLAPGDIPAASWDTPDKGHVGVIVARESTDVPTKIEGIIAEVKVGIGDRVNAGDPIAVIDDRPIREELAMAQANARAASAESRRARVALAEARSRYARRKAGEGDVISKEEAETAKFAAQQAGASRSAAGASAAEQRTRVQQLERMLEETTIVAPFAGTISVRYVDSGVLVPRGSPVVRLIASDELWVRFAVPAEEARRYEVGDEVRVVLDSVGREVVGVVRRIAPDLDPVSQMVTAEAELRVGSAQNGVQAGLAAWVNPSKNRPAPPGELR